MTTAQLAEDEWPARTALKAAQERLAAALVAAEAAAQSLARGRETLGELEKRRDAAHAEVANEARARAEAVEQGVCAVIGGAAQKRREIDDDLSGFQISRDILIKKNSDAQSAIGECEAALAAAVKGVIAEEVSPLLARMEDCERAASHLKSQLRALQYCGKWGICPETLPRQLLREPVNVHHADRPLTFDQQKLYDKRKAAWRTFADQLREDAGAMLTLGD
jgi:DNA repair exonuclease SbcCD ATPase subunit